MDSTSLATASPSDDDFTFAVRENGDVADDWAVYSASPAGAQMTSVNDATRHPNLLGDVPSGRVIYCDGGNGNGFAVGDNDAGTYNPNGTAWNDTRRVLSFWFKGGFSPVYVCVSTSAGSRFLMYYTSGGTDFVDGSGNVNVYLGWSAGRTTWRRFERDVAADWARVTSGASTWQNTDGFLVRPTSHANYDIWFDDIRLSNARTVTHNSLTGGAIGQIASSREVTATGGNGSLGLTDTWYHYDHIGNVMNFSNSSGALVAGSIQNQDAWGNVLSSSTTGAWASMTDGRHLTTKEYDADAGMYYFANRWFSGESAIFLTRAPMPPYIEHAYGYARLNPLQFSDPMGLFCGGTPTPVPGPTPSPTPGFPPLPRWGFPTTPPTPQSCESANCRWMKTDGNTTCHMCAAAAAAAGATAGMPMAYVNISCTTPGGGSIDHSVAVTPSGMAFQCLMGKGGVCACANGIWEILEWATYICGGFPTLKITPVL